jgi:hypothetical protein
LREGCYSSAFGTSHEILFLLFFHRSLKRFVVFLSVYDAAAKSAEPITLTMGINARRRTANGV